jgi:hypothetical protein
VTWTTLRHVLPFLSGTAGTAGVLLGLLVGFHSVPAAANRDWQFFAVQILCAAIVLIGGVLVLMSALEVRK